MSVKIGFVIVTYANPEQLLRLVRRLQHLYDNPSIVCHHDFSQCALRVDKFPNDIRFVLPHEKTGWGKFAVVTAALRALELLYQKSTPDWFVLLSGSDYPTMRADDVLADLSSCGGDALLDLREVPSSPPNLPYELPENPTLQHFVSTENLALAWRRYVGFNAWFPIIRAGPRVGRHTMYFPFEMKRWSPFDAWFKCFYGDHWFSGNSKVAQILLTPTQKHLHLRRHLRWRVVPEECYYHSVLGNSPHVKIVKATRRYSEWLGGGAHPQFLTVKDLPAMISSEAHFARKFEPDTPVLDEIDRLLR
jgi:Core-2/I-Branching enzyme